jgi:hypothetical protein
MIISMTRDDYLHGSPVAMSVDPRPKTKRRISWLVWLCLVAVAAAIVFAWAGPSLAVRRFLASTYTQDLAPQQVKTRVLWPGLAHTSVRVEAFFRYDPDYGNDRAAPEGTTYRGDVTLARKGLGWVPADGGVLSSGATYGLFNGHWFAVDPEVERLRAPDDDCG